MRLRQDLAQGIAFEVQAMGPVNQAVTDGVGESRVTDRRMHWSGSNWLAMTVAAWNAKALALIKKISPVAWRHIHLNGHYTFRGVGQTIDLNAVVAGVNLS